MRRRFTFVILNYDSLKETIECVKSIETLAYDNKYIVIVDNASKNQRVFFDRVKQEFKEYTNVRYLKSEMNGGYARGNNIGIHYAKYTLESDFVCVINPDTIVITPDFIEKAIEAYDKYTYAICGPRIVYGRKNGNPLGGYSEKKWLVAYRLWEDYRIYYVKKWDLQRFNFLKKNNKDIKKAAIQENYKGEKTRVLCPSEEKCLSGACVIFSPSFLRKYEGFCNQTFLYCEEYILAYACYNLLLKVFYYDEIEILHLGGCSTGVDEMEERNRQLFLRKIGRKSCKTLLKILMHKKTKIYLEKLIMPTVDEYEEIKELSKIVLEKN